MAPTRCSACRKFVRKDDSVVCTEDCGAAYHTACATERLGYDPTGSHVSLPFHCDSCTMHRSSVTPRTSEGAHECSASHGSSSSSMITLDDVMQQLKQSSGVMDAKLGLIQESLTRMERTMGAIRADVADLSASHQLLSERVSVLEARAELAHSDPHVMREDSLALNPRFSDLTSRLSHIESSRASPDVTISGIPASVTDSPRTMVLKVFEALGIPELAVDVLEIRSLTKGNGSTIGDPQRRSAAAGSTLSFIVTLKSPGIRDHIISRKRAKGNLTISQVFALDQPGSVNSGKRVSAVSCLRIIASHQGCSCPTWLQVRLG